MAMNEKAISEILMAEIKELAAIKEAHGEKYNSDHEGWAILKEEYDECTDALLILKERMKATWQKIRKNESDLDTEIKLMRFEAFDLACEAVQCMAVCDKWSEGRK